MSLDASVPKALYQANIDLALRIAGLLQENGAQWFELFAAEANARLDEATQSGKQGFGPFAGYASSLSQGVAPPWARLNPDRWHALMTQMVASQSHFAEGLQAALQRWQMACSEAFETASAELFPGAPAGFVDLPGWEEMAGLVRNFVAQFVPEPAPEFVPQHVPTRTPSRAPGSKAATAPVADPGKVRKPAKHAAGSAGAKLPSAARKPTKSGATAKTADKTAAEASPRPAPAVVTGSRRSRKPAG